MTLIKFNKIQLKLINYIGLQLKRYSTKNMVCKDIVWMDLEMTGLDFMKDHILEASCLITDKDLSIRAEGPCIVIKQTSKVLNEMDEWCKEHHKKSGLIEKSLNSNLTLMEGEKLLLDFLKQHIPEKQCPLAGNSVYMDRVFLAIHMPSLNDYLHYRTIDVSTIKELCGRWCPKVYAQAPLKKFAHRSLDDIKESIEELKYYRNTFFRIDSVQ